MNFIKKIFGLKETAKPHNFSQIISGRERLIVFLPDDIYDSYIILNYISSWSSLYNQIIVFIPRYSFNFFSRFRICDNLNYKVFSDEQSPLPGSSIVNFNLDREIDKYLRQCTDSTIANVTEKANLQFIPAPQTAEELLQKFAGFAALPIKKNQLTFELTQSEQANNKQKYFHNRFPDFVLHLTSSVSNKQILKLIEKLKLSFSANIYFTDRTIKNIDYPNLEKIEIENFLQLYLYAVSCNMFFTSDYSIAALLQELGINCIHLGVGFKAEYVYSVGIEDETKMQETVLKLMKKVND